MTISRLARTFPFSATLALLAVSASAQTSYYVNGSCGNDAWTGLSPVCQTPDGPKATLQAGITPALFGDTVLVSDGVYTGAGNKNLGLGNGVVLRSQKGSAQCIIDCEGVGRAFMFPGGEGPDTVVDGFTVTNGSASGGGAFHCYYNSAPSITNCIIKGNTDTGEGGGAIYATVAFPTITNCTITGNTSVTGGGAIYSLFGTPTIVNCTIVGNTTTGSGGALHASATSSLTVTNSILWANVPDEIYVDAGSTVAVSYSDVKGGWAGTGNMASDPMFLNPGKGNLRLLLFSPCVDAGDNSAVPLGIVNDLDSNPRFVGSLGFPARVDLGPYECQVRVLPRSTIARPLRDGRPVHIFR